MIIFGVDPGSRTTGYGIVSVCGNRFACLDYGGIRTEAPTGELPDLQVRLNSIFETLSSLLAQYSPDCLVVENVFYARNARSALMLGHVRGVILLAASQSGLPVFEYSPLEVKKAVTGYGRADKVQVQTMVQRLLNLEAPPTPFDAADALALALCRGFGGARTGKRGSRWTLSDLKKIQKGDPC